MISIFWIWGLAGLLIDVLNLTGEVAKVPTDLLGMTFLGIGNAMAGKLLFDIIDIFTGIALARMGFSEMAMTGCVSEPLFSQAFGLGICMLINAITEDFTGKIGPKGSIRFNPYNHHPAYMPFMGIAVCSVTLMVFLIYNAKLKFQLTKIPAIIQLVIYGLAFVAMFLIFGLGDMSSEYEHIHNILA